MKSAWWVHCSSMWNKACGTKSSPLSACGSEGSLGYKNNHSYKMPFYWRSSEKESVIQIRVVLSRHLLKPHKLIRLIRRLLGILFCSPTKIRETECIWEQNLCPVNSLLQVCGGDFIKRWQRYIILARKSMPVTQSSQHCDKIRDDMSLENFVYGLKWKSNTVHIIQYNKILVAALSFPWHFL